MPPATAPPWLLLREEVKAGAHSRLVSLPPPIRIRVVKTTASVFHRSLAPCPSLAQSKDL